MGIGAETLNAAIRIASTKTYLTLGLKNADLFVFA